MSRISLEALNKLIAEVVDEGRKSGLPTNFEEHRLYMNRKRVNVSESTKSVPVVTPIINLLGPEPGDKVICNTFTTSEVSIVNKHQSTADCPVCLKTFPSMVCMMQHNNLAHSAVTHDCGVCGKTFKYSIQLIRHMRVHQEQSRDGESKDEKVAADVNVEDEYEHQQQKVKETVKATSILQYKCTSCNLSFATARGRSSHMRRGHGMFVCETCEKTFHTAGEYQCHKRQVHEKPKAERTVQEMTVINKCNRCDKDFASWHGYRMHMLYKHGNRIVLKADANTCKECDKRFSTTSSFHMHMLRKHKKCLSSNSKTVKTCRECNRDFPGYVGFRVHMFRIHKIHLPSEEFWTDAGCKVCNKTFANNQDLELHMLHKHKKLDTNAAEDSQIKDSVLNRQTDGTNRRPGKVRLCRLCKKQFSSHFMYRKHLSQEHKDDRQCKVCLKRFDELSSLIGHIRLSHGMEKCMKCSMMFTSMTHLTRHMKYFCGKPNHKCAICGTTFPTVVSLYAHNKEAHGNKSSSAKCPICNRTFVDKRQLLKHSLIHSTPQNAVKEEQTKLNKFKCLYCERRFFSIANRNRHINCSHRNQLKKHQCEKCKQYFISSLSIQRHLKKGCTGSQLPSKKAKDDEVNTWEHLPTVDDSKNFKESLECEICEMVLTTAEALAEHKLIEH